MIVNPVKLKSKKVRYYPLISNGIISGKPLFIRVTSKWTFLEQKKPNLMGYLVLYCVEYGSFWRNIPTYTDFINIFVKDIFI